MKNTKKKLKNQSKVVKYSFQQVDVASFLSKTQASLVLHSFIATFPGSNITKYSGLNTVAKYMNHQNIVRSISSSFATEWHNATKFGVNQVLMAITLASISGISRIYRIAAFSGNGLVKALLSLDKAINENAISSTLKNLGQNGARKLQMFLLSRNARWIRESKLESITLNADSTVKSVCGNQEGADKGFNTTKKGAKSYHPLLVFVSEMKLLYHTWFRTGSAYTANGIVEFLKEVQSSLTRNVRKVFFRADSGFFSGKLFDLLESFNWDYLVKVKLKNLDNLLKAQIWIDIEGLRDVSICAFSYQAKSWQYPRVLKAMRSVKEYVEILYLGKKTIVPVYQYVCYASNYDIDAMGLHELYKQRSNSEFCDERDQSKLVLNWRAKKRNMD